MKKIGFFTSFGLGGGDHTNLQLTSRLIKHYGNEHFIIFYNNYSLPNPTLDVNNQTRPCRYKNYLEFCEPIKILNVMDFNKYNLDILFVHRGGDELWLLPNFENTEFNFKIIEINFHGALQTKADLRIFPSQSLVNYRGINNIPHVIINNPISQSNNLSNLREELNIKDKFIVGRVARSDDDIYCDINLICYKQIEDDNTIFLYLNPSDKAKLDSKNLNIKNIIFLEPTICNDMLDKIYNTFDVHAHSNQMGETFGNSVAESYIRGIPTISHEGFIEWPQAHREFFIHTPELYVNKESKNNMITKYTNMLYKLKTDIEYRKNVSKLQQDYAFKNFAADIVINKYIQVIDNM